MKVLHSLFLMIGFIVSLIQLPTCQAQSELTAHTLKLDSPENAPKVGIEDFAWMAGRWQGKGFAGIVEENWNPPLGGTMIGSFRLVRDGAPNFYEFLALVPQEESVAYKVKHFNPDLTGWEPKEESVDFPLVRVTKDTAWFQGLTVVRDGDRITHYLAMKKKDGSYGETTLQYTKRQTTIGQAEKDFQPLVPKTSTVPVMVLGSYHMSNPGQDMFNLEADDVKAPKRQREIQAVVDRLAFWKPTKVAVESTLGDSATIARYQAFLKGELTDLRKSEKEQIGFRLAKQLGHQTIYPIDVRMNLKDDGLEAVIGSDPQKYGKYVANLQTTGQAAISTMGKWLSEGTIGTMLYNMNDVELTKISHALYFQAFVPIVKGDDYAGADMVNTWYQRNLRIFSNLHQINDRPDDRIFVIYGQGHKALIEKFVADSPYFRSDNVQDYLKGL